MQCACDKLFAASLLAVVLCLAAGCGGIVAWERAGAVDVADTDRLLVVVNENAYAALAPSLERYADDLSVEGRTAYLHRWDGGTAEDLRGLIRSLRTELGVGGVFLIGDLPAAWYEQVGFKGYEEFPCDLYFMDTDGSWRDRDGDGLLDWHSRLEAELFVSRVEGSSWELERYFDKVRRYRDGSLSVWKGAFVFKDNDWVDFHRGSSFELASIYPDVVICEDPDETVREGYVRALTETGAEYVYQWIHAFPPLLCVQDGASFDYIHTQDIRINNFKGMFYNLYNCSAARFTEDNLAMTYLASTDFGLAALGSTKVGGNFHPRVFHAALAAGACWGDSFKAWYNDYGVTDDRWFLGMVIAGDPMLTLSVETRKSLKACGRSVPPDESAPDPEEILRLEEVFRNFDGMPECGSFEEYRNAHPQLFGG